MPAEGIVTQPELALGPEDRVMIVGAGGFTANTLYLPNLGQMGVENGQLILVDTDQERLQTVGERYDGATTFQDTDHAFEQTAEDGGNVAAIFILSNTGAHVDNIRSITRAADAGRIDLSRTRIWSEKPVAPPEIFAEVQALAADHPDFDLSVGYILRFSETLAALHDYLQEHGLSVTGLDWEYGKDRRHDPRPTQGVYPDEIVHPLSVSDLIMAMTGSEVLGVDVDFARIERNQELADNPPQAKAHAANPTIPAHPTSDVETRMQYKFGSNGDVTRIPVSIKTSFLLHEERRQVTISVSGPEGPDQLTVSFDEQQPTPGGGTQRVDILRTADGTTVSEWSGNKAALQVARFLGVSSANERGPDPVTSLEGEARLQKILTDIGDAALRHA